MANLNPKRCISDHIPGFEFVDLLLQPLVFLFEVGYVFRLDVLVLLQVVHLRVLLLTATEIQHKQKLKTRQKGKRLPCYHCTVFFAILNQFFTVFFTLLRGHPQMTSTGFGLFSDPLPPLSNTGIFTGFR